jgi:hypothetical protein
MGMPAPGGRGPPETGGETIMADWRGRAAEISREAARTVEAMSVGEK